MLGDKAFVEAAAHVGPAEGGAHTPLLGEHANSQHSIDLENALEAGKMGLSAGKPRGPSARRCDRHRRGYRQGRAHLRVDRALVVLEATSSLFDTEAGTTWRPSKGPQ